ncbi:MAG TPA: hypothetical protein VFA57_18770 [Pseudolabrys sp.]|nr:hypothetical protein [Pseudolabrys sp.]
MIKQGPSPADGEHRVLQFRRGSIGVRQPLPRAKDDLAKYARAPGTDDYRHRMLVNAAAFLFVTALVAAGLWLANAMADLRRNEDCVLSGRPNCMPLQVNKVRF